MEKASLFRDCVKDVNKMYKILLIRYLSVFNKNHKKLEFSIFKFIFFLTELI